MKRQLFIDDTLGRIRAAVVEDGELREMMQEKQIDDDQTESLFFGRVQSIRKSINAAFIDIGSELNAFLPLDEQTVLRCGEMIVVQGAAKQTTETKGLRVTSRINLAGKWLVLIPGGSDVHISKKIKDPELRAELLEIGNALCPDGFGLIVRTASGDVTEALLADEVQALQKRWHEVLKRTSGMAKPGLLYRRERLDMRLIRDVRDISSITTNSQSGYKAMLQAKAECRIDPDTEVVLFEERNQLLFDAFGIEHQIDKALKKRVWLPCGGYLIIDPCEAMTVIDVNSGRMTLGRGIEDTAFRVNLEAADEAAKQIRLRDISGIVIIDFIDMTDETHRRMIIERMKQAVQADRAHVVVEGLTKLGLMEITRRRVHSPLRKLLSGSCSYCSGGGDVLSAEEVAHRALRQVRRLRIAGQRGPFVIRCGQGAAQTLESMSFIESDCSVFVCAIPGKHAEKFDIEQLGEGMPVPKGAVELRYEVNR